MLVRRTKSALILSVLYAAGMSPAAAAEEALAATASAPVLETITVIGTRTEKSVFDNPRSVTVLSEEDMRRTSLEGLAEMLRDVPGVQILDASVPGMKRVEIRGESSRRNVILIDGQEITDHSSYGTPLLIDPSAVARVEVVKGPSSVLYGSKAIGGVVNVVTKTGGGARALEGEIAGAYFSATDGYSVAGSVIGAAGRVDYRLTGSRTDHHDRETADGTLDGTSYEHDSLSAHLGISAGRHYFALKADQYNLASDSYVDPEDFGPPITEFTLDLPRRDREKIGLFWDATELTPWLKKFHADAYYQTVDRLFIQDIALSFGGPAGMTSRGESEDEGTTKGFSAQLDFVPHPSHQLITGIQYQDDNLDTVKTATTTILPFPGIPMVSVTTDDATIETTSLYAQDEWTFGDGFALLFGARYYHVSAELNESNHSSLTSNEDDHVAGSIGFTYSGLDNHVLRLHASQGYVYPTLLQLFVDSPVGSGGVTFGSPDLDPETSDSIEFGWRYQTSAVTVDTSLFYSKAEDYIAAEFIDGGPNRTWENVDEATTWGAELYLEWNPGVAWNMRPYLNGTWLRRRFEAETYSTYDTFTPRLTGRAGVRFDLSHRGWADAYVRGATDADLEEESGIVESADSWATFNVSMGMDLGARENVQLTLLLNNITDTSYQAVNEVPGTGRSVELSARVAF